jgi:hypothetical protein
MNNQRLTIGILLSLASVGCAGLGAQPASSLAAQLQNRTGQGVDALWDQAAVTPRQGLESPHYAAGLGNLWIPVSEPVGAVTEAPKTPSASLGDLWNPSSVTRPWVTNASQADADLRGTRLFGDNGRAKQGGRKSAAQ